MFALLGKLEDHGEAQLSPLSGKGRHTQDIERMSIATEFCTTQEGIHQLYGLRDVAPQGPGLHS